MYYTIPATVERKQVTILFNSKTRAANHRQANVKKLENRHQRTILEKFLPNRLIGTYILDQPHTSDFTQRGRNVKLSHSTGTYLDRDFFDMFVNKL